MVAQDFLIFVRTVLAATVAVKDAATRRGPERDGQFQRADRQIPFQAITDGSTDDAPGVQAQDHHQIEPTLAGPDIADVTRPFLIGLIGSEIALQQVRRDVERVIAVRRRLEITRSFSDDSILTHQPPDAPVPHVDTNFLQLFGHSWAAVAGGAVAEGPQAAWADIHHAAQPIDRKGPTLFFDEPNPHGFWLAKNWGVF